MTSPKHAYEDAEQHIRQLQTERSRLTEALIDAERQYAVAVAQEFNAGRIGWTEMYRAYQVIRDGGLTGFLARWLEVLPYTAQKMSQLAALDDSGVKKWSGTGMDVYNDPARPPKGIYVAYVLYGADGEPVYVGSTRSFTNRLCHHRSDKVWATWRAYRCRDRAHASEVKRRLLQRSKEAAA